MLIFLSGKDPLKDKVILPVDIETSDYFLKVESYNKKTFDKMRTLFLKHVSTKKPSKSSKLVYTRTAIMIGHQSIMPHAEVTYVWCTFEKIFGNDEETIKKAIGTFLRWAVAKQPDKYWLLWVEKTGEENSKGEEITISHYWINKSYVFQGVRPPLAATEEDVSSFTALFNKKHGKEIRV